MSPVKGKVGKKKKQHKDETTFVKAAELKAKLSTEEPNEEEANNQHEEFYDADSPPEAVESFDPVAIVQTSTKTEMKPNVEPLPVTASEGEFDEFVEADQATLESGNKPNSDLIGRIRKLIKIPTEPQFDFSDLLQKYEMEGREIMAKYPRIVSHQPKEKILTKAKNDLCELLKADSK